MPTLRCSNCGTPAYVSVFSNDLVRTSTGGLTFTCDNCRSTTTSTTKQPPNRRLCQKCTKPIKSTRRCEVCGYCNSCCTCDMFCRNCNKTHSKGWKICNYCRLCSIYCKCRKRPKFLHDLSNKEKRTSKLINTLPRSLALEIEVANWGGYNTVINKLPDFLRQWWRVNVSLAHDSSVTSGSELVLAPQSGDNFVKGALRTSSVLQQSGVTFDSTCGFHVHVNASDYNALAIKNILWIWKAYHHSMQGHLYNADRVNNNYCKETTDWLEDIFPLIESVHHPRILRAVFTWVCAVGSRYFGAMTESSVAARHQINDALDHPEIRKLLPGSMRGENIIPGRLMTHGIKYIIDNKLFFPKGLIRKDGISVVRNHYNPIRYSSVNLASLWYRGSLEFRIKEATCALDELLMWPLFCGWMTEIAASESFSTIQKVTNNKTLAEFVSHRTYQGRRWFPEAVETWVHSKLGVI